MMKFSLIQTRIILNNSKTLIAGVGLLHSVFEATQAIWAERARPDALPASASNQMKGYLRNLLGGAVVGAMLLLAGCASTPLRPTPVQEEHAVTVPANAGV